jgi:hypothetical protein
MLGNHSLTWKSSKQSTISLLTLKAEYKVLSDLGRELAWLASFVKEIQVNTDQDAITVKVNNQGAINLAKSKILQNGFCTKRMDIWLHFVRELLDVGLINLVYVSLADFLTNPLAGAHLNSCWFWLGCSKPCSLL